MARLEIWGDLAAAPGYVAGLRERADRTAVVFKGGFDESERAAVLAGLDVLVVPSIGLESFGIAAREAMAAGLPVLSSRLGALVELGLDGRCGATFAPGDAEDLRALVERLAADPGILEGWRRNLPPTTTMAEHAAEVDRVYQAVLGRTPRSSGHV